ncbi:MAG TPA: carboxypeptidase regulatory-like domain-containing protein [Thermoanaerobaculia bacterium]|nr:carboxypeptidase regulatory-like domain-containing protein [Thermoanaerobaculia bacterium]
MKTRLASVVGALAVLAFARGAFAEAMTLRVREQVTVDLIGVTAAYVIDPSVAEVIVPQPGRVLIIGKSVGSTQLITVTPTNTAAYLITVAGEKSTAEPQRYASGPIVRYGSRYVSESGQLQNAFDVFTRDGERLSELHLINVHYFRDSFGQARTSFPLASYHVKTPRRDYTLLDDFVDVSPLTVPSTQIRGVHWLERGLEVHAGYAAPSMYEGLFLPVDRRWVAGAGYSIEGGRWRWTPNVYGFFSQSANRNARRGVVASLISEYRSGETLRARGEVAVGGKSIGASTELNYDTAREHLHGLVVFKPNDFPSLGLVDIRGLRGVVSWDRAASDRLTLSAYSSYDRFELLNARQRSAFANVGLRYALTKPLVFLTGAEITDLRAFSTSLRSVAIPVGLTWDVPRFGAGATYRFIQNSGTSRRGSSLRLTARAGGPALQVSAWGERRRDAPSLDLIFREVPDLQAALIRLGISVHSPEELARVLRDNAILVNLGFIEGVTVNLVPRHTLGGFDLNWMSPWQSRDRVSLHAIYDRTEGVRDVRDVVVGTMTYSRRLVGSSDIYGSLTRWRSRSDGFDVQHSSYEIGVRADVSEIPALFQRRGPIEGFVFFDPEMRGMFSGQATPISGIAVALDGTRTTATDSRGRYVFTGISPGLHRVSAMLPQSKPAFFTTPSHMEVAAGSKVDFGLVWSPARLSGRVISDANAPIRGAAIVVTPKSGPPIRATVDSEGIFRIDLPAGDYRADLATESLPPGYVVAGETQRGVHLVADQPAMIIFQVLALRSVAGVAAPGAEIEIEPLGRKTVTDAAGNFVLRSLPPGTFKLTARSGGRATTKMVVLPDEPASMHDVNLMLSSGKPAPAPAMAAAKESSSQPAGAFVVQAGAFRKPSNASRVIARLRALGMQAFTRFSNGITFVRVGPFDSRQSAAAVSERLRQARIDALVMPR